jgi:hypothetical protein
MSDKFGFKKAFLALAAIQVRHRLYDPNTGLLCEQTTFHGLLDGCSVVQTITLGLYDKLTANRFTFGLGTMSIFFTLGGAWPVA